MASAITCDSADGLPAVLMVTIVANGDVSAWCARCAPEILAAMAASMAPPDGDGEGAQDDDSGMIEAEPEDSADLPVEAAPLDLEGPELAAQAEADPPAKRPRGTRKAVTA